jgi:hypothetical protein
MCSCSSRIVERQHGGQQASSFPLCKNALLSARLNTTTPWSTWWNGTWKARVENMQVPRLATQQYQHHKRCNIGCPISQYLTSVWSFEFISSRPSSFAFQLCAWHQPPDHSIPSCTCHRHDGEITRQDLQNDCLCSNMFELIQFIYCCKKSMMFYVSSWQDQPFLVEPPEHNFSKTEVPLSNRVPFLSGLVVSGIYGPCRSRAQCWSIHTHISSRDW